MPKEYVIRNFFTGWVPTSESILVKANQGERIVLKAIHVRNHDLVNDLSMSLRVRRAGNYMRLGGSLILPEHTWIIDEAITLEAGDYLAAFAGVANMASMKISGISGDT